MSLFPRIACLSLIAILVAVSFVLHVDQCHDTALAEARTLLAEQSYERAAKSFAELRNSWFVGETARAGELLSRAFAGTIGTQTPLSARQLSMIGPQVELLLTQALLAGNFEGLLAASQLAREHPSSHLFQIAALLELGYRKDAETLWATFSERPSHWLTERIREAFQLPEAVRAIIRDRRGTLMAWVKGGDPTILASGLNSQPLP